MPINLDSLIKGALKMRRDANLRAADPTSKNESVRKGTKFVPAEPTAAQERDRARPAGYFAVFCSHNRPYWQTCTKCGRDKSLAQRNADMVLKAVGGAAFFTKTK